MFANAVAKSTRRHNTRFMAQEIELRATAFHEAGHAVAAFMLGRAFTRVSIKPDDLTVGRCSFRTPGTWYRPEEEMSAPTRRMLEHRIMISLAGPETEARATGAFDPQASQEDLDRALDHACLMAADPSEASAYVEWLRLRTVNLMKQDGFWNAVRALAETLLRRNELPYRHARIVIQNAFGGSRPREAVPAMGPV